MSSSSSSVTTNNNVNIKRSRTEAIRGISPPNAPSPKRARFNAGDDSRAGVEGDGVNVGVGEGSGGTGMGKREVSKGARWVVLKLDELIREYKEAVIAAALVIQFRAFAKRSGSRIGVPTDLVLKLDSAWTKYEMTRRRIEAYNAATIAHASTPSKPPLPPRPTLPLVSILHKQLDARPLASPVPLASSASLAFDPSANDQADLAGLGFGIEELTALINGTHRPTGDASGAGGGDVLAQLLAGSDQTNGGEGMTPGTEQLLASLSEPTMSTQPQQPQTQQPQTQQPQQQTQQEQQQATLQNLAQAQSQISSEAQQGQTTSATTQQQVDSLLAQLGATDQTQGQDQGDTQVGNDFTFDFGDVDISELVGLLDSTNTTATLNAANVSEHPPMTGAETQDQSSIQIPSSDQPPPIQQQQQQSQQQQSQQQSQQQQSQQQQQQQQQHQLQQQQQQPQPQQQHHHQQQQQQQQQQPQQQPPPPQQQTSTIPETSIPTPLGLDIDLDSLIPGLPPADPTQPSTSYSDIPQGLTDDYGLGAIDMDDFNFGDVGIPNVEEEGFEEMFAQFK